MAPEHEADGTTDVSGLTWQEGMVVEVRSTPATSPLSGIWRPTRRTTFTATRQGA